jgi:hypothetical protein
MKKDITNYITNCPSCLQNKRNYQSPEGLLQPLPILLRTWEHITMDFLTKLPETSQGHTAILVVVYRLSKRAHFLATRDNDDAVATTRTFLDNIFKLHGMPRSITLDQDGCFVSTFWKKLCGLLGTKLRMSTTKHPQTDGQSERTIQTLEEYLRSFISYNQKDWDQKLSLAEFAYNASTFDTTKLTPFQVDNNHQPYTPTALLAMPENEVFAPKTKQLLKTINTTLTTCQNTLKTLKLQLLPPKPENPTTLKQIARANATKAQETMAHYANKTQKNVTIKVDDYVMLSTKILEQKQYTSRPNHALSAQFIGPFKVTRQITPVTFELHLPGYYQLKHRFHVSNLCKCHQPSRSTPAYTDFISKLATVPITKISGQCINNGIYEYRVEWENTKTSHWVPAKHLEQANQLILQFEDNLLLSTHPSIRE